MSTHPDDRESSTPPIQRENESSLAPAHALPHLGGQDLREVPDTKGSEHA